MFKASIEITENNIKIEKNINSFQDIFEEMYIYRRDYLNEYEAYDMQFSLIEDVDTTNTIYFQIIDTKSKSIVLKVYNVDNCNLFKGNEKIDNNKPIELFLEDYVKIEIIDEEDRKHYYKLQLMDIRKGNLILNI